MRGKWIIFDNDCKNGLFKFDNYSYQRIRASEIEENGVYCFGSGKNVKIGAVIKKFSKLYFAFKFNCFKFEKMINSMADELEIMKQKYEKAKQRVKYLEYLKNKKDSNSNEDIPVHMLKLSNVVIFDTNILVERGQELIERVIRGNFFVIIPRVVLNELDGLKKIF